MTASGARSGPDWRTIRDLVDLPSLAEALLGPPSRREGGRALWRCPFHEERSPSFVLEKGRATWRCFGCGEHGDGADLVGRLEHLEFPASAKRAAEIVGLYLPESGGYTPPTPRVQAPPPPAPSAPTGLDQASGFKLVDEAEALLWGKSGAPWLKYLREDRGLADETIREARLGWTPGADLKTRDGRPYRASGIVVPWLDEGRLASIKLRRTDGRDPKYLEILRDRPRAFPSLGKVEPGWPLVVVEGEFDALLLHQEIGDLAAVITIGSASSALTTDLLQSLLPASPWCIAVDADAAGEKFAAGWPARAKRVRPLGGEKDWSDLHRTGFNRIRYQWCGILPHPRPLLDQTWHEAASYSENPDNRGFQRDAEAHRLDPEWLREFNARIGRANPPELED